MAYTVRVTASTHTVTGEQFVILDAGSNAITVTLPPTKSAGEFIFIVCVDDTNTVTIDPKSTETIWDGFSQQTTVTMSKGDSLFLVPDTTDGTWWY
jgi:hypothetical protein